ncbi:hypothetical protein SNA_25255 [Streptomyces natalensis ATCC 27448]|uniref:Transposase n=1 Tax=Streptomyces natalensis ATCC 27448 TaxID=1240678 RepID=A0A0D7CJQ1_9ACTN|nr:hypothetical protein SNA_25255 [Streptomyces natalensis ATCC 27448]
MLPHLSDVIINSIEGDGAEVHIRAQPRAPKARCPDCRACSASVHSRYERQVADVPVSGQPTRISLCVRRFFCHNDACPRRTFVEQVESLVGRRRRRSIRLCQELTSIGLALAGRAGARLAEKLSITVSRMTLLRLVRAIPDDRPVIPKVVGIDDFALRKGAVYGTVVINMETHRPIDVFAERDAETVATWLQAHPGIRIICRDRAGAYADGCRLGAPEATEIADRWHLWKNLGEAVEKTVVVHLDCLHEPPDETPEAQTTGTPGERGAMTATAEHPLPGGTSVQEAVSESRLSQRTCERYAAVQELVAKGYSLNAMSRELGLCFRTVQRFAHATTADALLRTVNRGSSLDRFKPYLHHRWNEGCTNATTLHNELHNLGWRGSSRTVSRYVQQLRALEDPPTTTPVPPKPRRVAGWIMSDPSHLGSAATVQLKNILARCPELQAAHGHVRAFAEMIQTLGGALLPQWLQHVRANDLPAFHGFANSLERDLPAVTAGLTLSWSNGPTEGTVNRIKMLKRQMYGRAKLDLLRCRVLYAT